MRTSALPLLALLLTGMASSGRAHEPGEAHYLANEAVVVRHGERAVMFDALFVDGLGTYLVPDAATRRAMDEARQQFEYVGAAFVSHIHADHFDARRTLAFMRARPEVRIFGPAALSEHLLDAGASPTELERVRAFEPEATTSPARVALDDLTIDVVEVPHSGPERFPGLQHLVFRVTLDDLTIAHLGDAEVDARHFTRHETLWNERATDVAFLPYWFFMSDEGREILQRHLNAHRKIGVHVPANAGRNPAGFRARLGGDAFVTPGETRVLKHEH